MNFSEFKRRLGEDPLSRDEEMLRARNSAPEFEQAALDAEAFERALQNAVNIRAPEGLVNTILDIAHTAPKRRNWVPLAMAATVLLAVGAAGIAWKQSHRWDSVDAYVEDHYSKDGDKLVANSADGVSEKDINRIMARLDAFAGPQLSDRIRFIKLCPTPDGRGAHMVVSTSQGPVTIIYMPNTKVSEGEMLVFDQMHALLVNLDHGSVAIIGTRAQNVENLQAMVRNSLKTGLIDA